MTKSPLSDAGFLAEKAAAEYLAKLFDLEKMSFSIVHSICSKEQAHLTPGVICWIDTPSKNSQYGDLRIYKRDIHGRPVLAPYACIDVKFSRDWDHGSVTFKKRSESPRSDAIAHLRDWVGGDVDEHLWWYLSCTESRDEMISLADVRRFVAESSEDEMKGICRLGKFDNGDSWYFSLGDVTVDHELPSLQTWAREFLPGAIG